jgi:hypothetical protein
MNARSALITVIAAALGGACAATPVQEEQQEPQPSLGSRIFVGITEIIVNAVFDAAFSPHEKQKHASNSWAHSSAPAAYAVPPKHRPEAPPKKPVSLKKSEGSQ